MSQHFSDIIQQSETLPLDFAIGILGQNLRTHRLQFDRHRHNGLDVDQRIGDVAAILLREMKACGISLETQQGVLVHPEIANLLEDYLIANFRPDGGLKPGAAMDTLLKKIDELLRAEESSGRLPIVVHDIKKKQRDLYRILGIYTSPE